MLISVLENIADYLKLNTGTFLKNAYHNVTVERKDVKGTIKTYPATWKSGAREGKPIIADTHRNYIYLRPNGNRSITTGERFTSCTPSQQYTYPVKLVGHFRPKDNGYSTPQIVDTITQLLGAYKYTNTTVYKSINLFVTASNVDKFAVYAAEITNPDKQLGQTDWMFSIDFNISAVYNPGTCVENEIMCGLPASITQVNPCDGVGDLGLQINYESDDVDVQVIRARNNCTIESVSLDTNATSVALYKNGVLTAPPFSVSVNDILAVVLTRTGAGAAQITINCTDILTEEIEALDFEYMRWTSGGALLPTSQSVTEENLYSFPNITALKSTAPLGAAWAEGELNLAYGNAVEWTSANGGSWTVGIGDPGRAATVNNNKLNFPHCWDYDLSTGNLTVIESGTTKFTYGSTVNNVITLKIVAEDTNTVKYYVDGGLEYTSGAGALAATYKCYASIAWTGHYLVDIKKLTS